MKFPFPEKIPITLCILAAAAVALLLLLPGTAGDSGIQTAVTRLESEDTQEYVENLENRLSALLCSCLLYTSFRLTTPRSSPA